MKDHTEISRHLREYRKRETKIQHTSNIFDNGADLIDTNIEDIADLRDLVKKLSVMLERSKTPDDLLGAVADTYPYVKADLLQRAREAIGE